MDFNCRSRLTRLFPRRPQSRPTARANPVGLTAIAWNATLCMSMTTSSAPRAVAMLALGFMAHLLSSLLSSCGREAGPDSAPEQQQWKGLELGSQELEMVFVRWIRGPIPLVVRQGADYIMEDELKVLRGQGVTGELVAPGAFHRGIGEKKARVLVVLSANVSASVDLRQPDGTNGIYLQSSSGFLLLPAATPTIAKSLTLRRYEHPMDGDTTEYSINMGSVLQGGTAIIWGK